jgi:MerR family transcriptional regulator/heat shock protein HspR
MATARRNGEGTLMDTDVGTELYAITAVVAQFEVAPETLVRYERAGLLRPVLVNEVRFYSTADIGRLNTIRRMTDIMGINLAGVDVVLRLLEEIRLLQRQLE